MEYLKQINDIIMNPWGTITFIVIILIINIIIMVIPSKYDDEDYDEQLEKVIIDIEKDINKIKKDMNKIKKDIKNINKFQLNILEIIHSMDEFRKMDIYKYKRGSFVRVDTNLSKSTRLQLKNLGGIYNEQLDGWVFQNNMKDVILEQFKYAVYKGTYGVIYNPAIVNNSSDE